MSRRKVGGSQKSGNSRKISGTSKLQSPQKVTSYSWEIEGSDYIRNVVFKALKDGEKLGFGLGGKGKRTEIVVIREGSQSYWKGIKKGYKVVTVNGNEIDDITVKASIYDVTSSDKDFTIGFLVPGKPDYPDSGKAGINSVDDGAGIPKDDQLEENKEVPVVEQKLDSRNVEASDTVPNIQDQTAHDESLAEEDIQIIDNGETEYKVETVLDDPVEDEKDVKDDYESLVQKIEKMEEVENVAQDALDKATKDELEEMKRRKEEEYDKLKAHEAALKELIKEKEKEFKESVTRKNLEELKAMRRTAKQVARTLERWLEELEKIRSMLQQRLGNLASGIQDLAASSAARDAKLRELEAEIRLLESKAMERENQRM